MFFIQTSNKKNCYPNHKKQRKWLYRNIKELREERVAILREQITYTRALYEIKHRIESFSKQTKEEHGK
jgi:hypothetical protein